MLDTTQINLTMTPAWQDHISHGDIVSFRFPLAEGNQQENPKARPCLILEINKLVGKRFALIAYGTTSPRRSNWGYEVHALREIDYLGFGLDRPTRFIGRRRLMVSLDIPGFAICGDTGSPVLGRLAGDPFERLQSVRARIQAERDMTAERLADRERRKRPSFTVEHRHPRRRSVVAAKGQG